jgi:LysM repeat protein
MSFWTLVRIVAGLVVMAVVVFTLLMVRHVRHEPLGGIFARLVPVAFEAGPMTALPEAGADLPEVDPGMKVFEKARERIAVGDLAAARDRLRTVVSIYPRSQAAPEARRIVGEMNIDELLSGANMANKQVYKVVRGDSYLGIAAKHDTNLDMIMMLNGLMDLRSLQPGQELVLMPLNLRVLVEPKREALSLWDGGGFVKEYPLLAVVGAPGGDQKTVIAGKSAVRDGKSFGQATEGYRGASKVLTVERMPLVIAAMPEDGDASALARGFYLSPPDMEELALLTRPGNQVEIRSAAR